MTHALQFDAATADLTGAAVALAVHLPAEHGLSPRPAGPGTYTPPGASRAVVAGVGDGGALVALIVSELVAGALEFGPDGTIPLDVALGPALSAAAEVLGVAADALQAPHEADPATFAQEPIGIALDDGPNHAASLVISVPAPPRATAATEAPSRSTEPVRAAADAALFDAVGAADERAHGFGGIRPIEFLSDVELAVTAELGRTRMTVRELLRLGPGSVVELDRAAGSHVDLLVNGRLIARGEVVVVDDEFGVRVSEVVARERGVGDPAERHG
jgi:flagellar motor switch protein FliN/FliY